MLVIYPHTMLMIYTNGSFHIFMYAVVPFACEVVEFRIETVSIRLRKISITCVATRFWVSVNLVIELTTGLS